MKKKDNAKEILKKKDNAKLAVAATVSAFAAAPPGMTGSDFAALSIPVRKRGVFPPSSSAFNNPTKNCPGLYMNFAGLNEISVPVENLGSNLKFDISKNDENFLAVQDIIYDETAKTVHVLYDCTNNGYASRICQKALECKESKTPYKLKLTAISGDGQHLECTITVVLGHEGATYEHECRNTDSSSHRRRLLSRKHASC